MNVQHWSRLLIAGGIGLVVAGCSGATSLTPTQSQSGLGPQQTQSGQRASAFSERAAPKLSSTARSALSVTNCTPVVTAAHGPMTAALVPSGAVDHATVNAAGCDIGIYLGPTSNGQKIDHTSITDANQYGVYADQAQNVSIDHTQVSKIGNHDSNGNFAPNGVQTGVGLYFSGATGSVDHTDIFQYQKNGTAFNCLWSADYSTCVKRSSVSVQHSTATGLGQVNYIAQNGFQYWDSDAPTFQHNIATNNMYFNPSDTIWNRSATGYLFLCTNVPSQQQPDKLA